MLSYELIQSFFTENGYVLELLAAIALFCHFLERKQHFALRALAAGCALMAFSVLCSFLSADIAPQTTERMIFSSSNTWRSSPSGFSEFSSALNAAAPARCSA